MMLLSLRRLNFILLAVFVLAPPFALAQSVEQKLKAAFLYRFTQFVEWPSQVMAENSGELVLCMLGNDSLEGALNDIEGKSAGHRTTAVHYIEKSQQINQCQIVFVNQPKAVWDEVRQQSQNAHVLTVSDQPGFAAAGGIIELVRVEKRIQFMINLDAAKAAELHISAHLLKLARHIYD